GDLEHQGTERPPAVVDEARGVVDGRVALRRTWDEVHRALLAEHTCLSRRCREQVFAAVTIDVASKCQGGAQLAGVIAAPEDDLLATERDVIAALEGASGRAPRR